MNKFFITYGDAFFEKAKKKIVRDAELTGEFHKTIAYDVNDLSDELKKSKIFSIKRGGGLWSWKPDVILKTLEEMDYGDALVYCDAGCQLSSCKEWNVYWRILEEYDIIAQRIYQRTENWTRKELIHEFVMDNGYMWPKMFQFQATIILKKTDFTMKLISEWRDFMIYKSFLAMDVTDEERIFQLSSFKENRHDQAIYSALIYKYLRNSTIKEKIYTMWEHLEDYDIFSRQAIRAVRNRTGAENISKRKLMKQVIKRIIKDCFYKPFVIIPQQFFFEKINN